MDREAFRAEVATAMIGQVQRIAAFVDPVGGIPGVDLGALRVGLMDVATVYATLLEEPKTALRAAEALCVALFGDQEPPESFWPTEAGLAVGLAIGYPRQAVPRAIAKVILNLSRQRIHELITLGILDAVDANTVTAKSVRDRLRASGRRAYGTPLAA